MSNRSIGSFEDFSDEEIEAAYAASDARRPCSSSRYEAAAKPAHVTMLLFIQGLHDRIGLALRRYTADPCDIPFMPTALLREADALEGHPIAAWLLANHDEFRHVPCELDIIDEASAQLAASSGWAARQAAAAAAVVAFGAPEVDIPTYTDFTRDLCGNDEDADIDLRAEIQKHVRRLMAGLEVAWPPPEQSMRRLFGKTATVEDAELAFAGVVAPTSDGLPWDLTFAAFLERIGRNGEQAAELLRSASRERAKKAAAGTLELGGYAGPGAAFWLWANPAHPLGMPWLPILAKALWFDVVQPDRERKARLSTAIATIPAFVADDVAKLASASTASEHDGRLYAGSVATNLALTLADLEGMRRVTASDAAELASGAYFWPTLHWLASTVHTQEIFGMHDPHIVRVEGGNEGLRRTLGIRTRDGGAQVRQVLEMLHRLSNSEPGRGRFLTLLDGGTIPNPAGGRPTSLLLIEVGLLMRPDAAVRLGLPVARWLLPVFDPGLIPTIGDHRTKGRQLNVAQSIAMLAHDRRSEIAAEGRFKLTLAEWRERAERFGLYRRSHANLQDRYFDALQSPPPKHSTLPLAFDRVPGSEPMLVRVGPDQYRLGDTFAPEWSHIIDAGNWSIAQSKRGKAAAKARRRRTEKLTKPGPKRRGR